MKFKTGDQVIITAGKDKGKKGQIVRVLPKKNQVIVKDANFYSRHIKPQGKRSGEIKKMERPLDLGKIAILNDKDQPDRIGYRVTKNGRKERIFKKTGKVMPELKKEKK